MKFESLGLDPALSRAVQDLAWQKPTQIQRDAIPPALDGQDILACAMTGSGKTAGFLLPLLHRLQSSGKRGTRALILAPTRELAAQVHADFVELAKYTKIRGVAIFGGVAIGPQEKAFRKGVDVVIATPGRLLDHMRQPGNYVRFETLEVLVLDEADRMLDMGFLPDIKRILEKLPRERQTLFFSATLPPPIVALSRSMLSNPVRLNVERVAAPASRIEQAVYSVPENLKADLFISLLRSNTIGNVICFTRTKHRSNRLSDVLTRSGIPNEKIHGNRSQAQRTVALDAFKRGKVRVLVATDIVARGIDVEALEHVVNFDVPNQPEDYIHRVGRTARADATGEAFTLVSKEEEQGLKAIERAIGKKLPRRFVEGFDYKHQPTERLEVPIAERIAAIRARKAEERARAKAKLERKAKSEAGGTGGGARRSAGGAQKSSGSTQKSAGSTHKSSGSAQKSAGSTHKSVAGAQKSAGSTHRSASSHKSAGGAYKSAGRSSRRGTSGRGR